MNYFISSLFRDWKWWAKLGFASVATINVYDIMSLGRVFNFWIVRGTLIAAVVGLSAYFVFQNRHDKKARQIEALLPAFIGERHVDLEKMRTADPEFQTLCYNCCHYDARRRCCGLCLYDRKATIKLHPEDRLEYCLYWNVTDHPLMALTKRNTPQGGTLEK